MSLLITASPWNSNENTDKKNRSYTSNKNGNSASMDDGGDYSSKKRPATMKRSYKYYTEPSPSDNNNTNLMNISNEDDDDSNHIISNSIQSSKTIQEQRNGKINKIMEKMSSLQEDNDGSGLGDFRPPPRPIVNNKGLEPVDLLPKTPSIVPRQSVTSIDANMSSKYRPNESMVFQNDTAELRDYNKIYVPASSIGGGGNDWRRGTGSNQMSSDIYNDDRLMKKIHYMIHLLEEQRKEKTDNIMEEFILYTFLGIFIIYIADSFSRSGKYIR